jgi:hypothetical protein
LLLSLFLSLFNLFGAARASAGTAELDAVRQVIQDAGAEALQALQPEVAKPITTADRIFSVPERENQSRKRSPRL